MRILLAAILMLAIPTWATELDNENGVINAETRELSGTVIIRVNAQTKEVSRLELDQEISTEEAMIAAIESDFSPVASNQVVGELDNDAGQSSWYYYWPNYNYWNSGYYYYYGNWYQPYYSYRFGGYYYHYYNRWYRWF